MLKEKMENALTSTIPNGLGENQWKLYDVVRTATYYNRVAG